MPSVVDLAIGPEPWTTCPRKLMQGLTLGSHEGRDGKDLVPNLEHLKIHGNWRECEKMMRAVGSRFCGGEDAAGGRLKRLTLGSSLVRNSYARWATHKRG